ncbi:MAG: type II 3-dehydroquinate dehydratase [Alphaproteobacteria bacterium]|nr:type II 3-dehydroquinate dehydratase [Alphaproteobacteria bacterium]
MIKILILNGPNLNMLGLREPEIYGDKTLDDIKKLCLNHVSELEMKLDFRQSNYEGKLVEWIHSAYDEFNGIIINAAAYTHTSIAIHDALKLLDIPIIEVHISDPKTREVFRHTSYIEPLAHKVIAGQGAHGYLLALDALKDTLNIINKSE